MSVRFALKQLKYYIGIPRYLAITKGRHYPKIFSIEVVLGCNLQCPECAIGGGHITRKKGCMTFEQFKVIVDKIRPYSRYLYLHIWGEPLLNKEIFDIIEYASKNCRTNISTNGMLISEESAERLITSGVSDLIVSIDGTSQEIYQQYRKGGDVEKAFLALRWLTAANKRHGNIVKIYPQFIVFEHNQAEMESFSKICNSIGVKPVFKAPYIRKGSRFKNSTINEFVRKPYDSVEAYKNAICNCMDYMDSFTINLEGNVVLCCYDANGDIVFGNIFEQSVHEIFYGPERQRFIKKVKSDRECPEFCVKNCLTYRLDI